MNNTSFAQKNITGTVTDETGSPLPGAGVVVKGTTIGAMTSSDGTYSIEAPETAVSLIFSFIGFEPKEVTITGNVVNCQLIMESSDFEEIVVIGYGQMKKKDATGSVLSVTSDDFNTGNITSPQDLIIGKTAGVLITTSGGAPGSGSTIRIRGGSSLSASNDPLFVIDGVPVDNDGISGLDNPLSSINPNVIESFTVLKDASATAIYGSRASNGVIIITTKKGAAGSKLKIAYNGGFSMSTIPNTIDVLTGDEYRTLIMERYADNPNAVLLLGAENTDWQSQIFKTAYGHDHSLSFSGSVGNLPYRLSLGYANQDGILKTSNLDRKSLGLNLSPTFFDNSLKISINLKASNNNNRFADRGAIGSAITFDPTQTVLDPESPYGGYFTWTQLNGDPITIAPSNPLAMLELREDLSTVNREIGNVQIDYAMPFITGLKATLNVAGDYSQSSGTNTTPEYASWVYDYQNGGGRENTWDQLKKNELLDFYFGYNKQFSDLSLDATAGYSWQHFYREGSTFETNIAQTDTITDTDYATESYLVSFFGRVNLGFKNKYLATVTVREDATSRFSPDTRWGLFPSVALAWRINEESFLKNSNSISNLKLRLGWGITGQQNIGAGDYPYLGVYTYGLSTAMYQFGDQFITTIRPEGYDANLKWEETETYNVGLDYGFAKNRIFGTVDVYYRKTTDLLNVIPVPAGTNFTNQILTNVGDLENKGIEFSLNLVPVQTSNLKWDIGFNLTYNENKITRLTAVNDSSYIGVLTGGISGGVGNTIQIHSVGYAANSFYVYEQVYDAQGKPIPGVYVDRNEDGVITDQDKYIYNNPAPDFFMGLSSKITYKNWDLSLSGRISLGNYVYDNVGSQYADYSNLYNSSYLNNVTSAVFLTDFNNPEYRYFSDYYVRNASYFRLDNATLGYNFQNIANKINMRVSLTGQNLLVITNYKGIDPEISGGIDNNVYPRPRIIILGLSLSF